jgi:hypothetical protein
VAEYPIATNAVIVDEPGDYHPDPLQWFNPDHWYPIGPAPIGWQRIPYCSRNFPHNEDALEHNAEDNADHYRLPVDQPPSQADVGVVLWFTNNVSPLWPEPYMDGLVIIEPAPCRHEQGYIWVRRLGSPWIDGYWANPDELSPVTPHILEAIGGRI